VLKNEESASINPLSNLKGDPIYITAGSKDPTVHPKMVNLQNEFYKLHDSNINYNPQYNEWHQYPNTLASDQLQFMLMNMEGSGITAENKIKADDPDWRDNGTIYRFD
jgi:hypothetical protein